MVTVVVVRENLATTDFAKPRRLEDSTNSSLSCLVLYGSWNDPSHPRIERALDRLAPLVEKASAQSDITGSIVLASSRIDPEDESTVHDAIHKLLAPEELPALVLKVQKGTQNPRFFPLSNLKARDLNDILWDRRSNLNAVFERILNALDSIRGTRMENETIRIFVSGDRSQVGKSSVCMGLIGTLVHKLGYPPSSIAYIKPATQCEATQLVALYCEELGVAHRAIGPIVYYKGFTRAFLAKETDPTHVLLEQAGASVDALARGRKVIIVDGVGYPAVGSICGTDNASVAASCGPLAPNGQREPLPVLLVGKKGVGDAVDSYNLNAAYFESKGVPVLGAIFNRLPVDGYYSLENCKKAITSYFDQHKAHQSVFGFLPEVESIASSRDAGVALELSAAKEFVEIFGKYVDVESILQAASRSLRKTRHPKQEYPNKRQKIEDVPMPRVRLTREQVELAAQNAGAAGG